MNYLSLNFVALTVISFVVFWIVHTYIKNEKGIIFQESVLLIAGFIFYWSYDFKYLIFLLFVAVVSFVSAICIEKSKYKSLYVFLSIGICVTLWFVIKELPWLLTLVSNGKTRISIIVPIGISYYILQAISYVVDVRKEKITAERSFFSYLLFLSYFPAIVQGPISRYDELMPKLKHQNPFDEKLFRKGIILILFGLVKKMVVADRLALIANYTFNEYESLSSSFLYIGALAYAFQLYTDFSGCVDICRGVSSLFGIELVINFNRPYFADSIKDFWNRWHLSFSRWLRDYIYIPLGGNRKGKVRKYLNIVATFAVSGIWHGAGFRFIAWGLLNAFYQIAGELTYSFRKKVKENLGIAENSKTELFIKRIIAFHLTLIAWIIFRANTLTSGLKYIFLLFTNLSFGPYKSFNLVYSGLSKTEIVILVLHLVVLFIIEAKTKSQEEFHEKMGKWHLFIRYAVYIVLILDVLFLGMYGSGYDTSGFLYGGF